MFAHVHLGLLVLALVSSCWYCRHCSVIVELCLSSASQATCRHAEALLVRLLLSETDGHEDLCWLQCLSCALMVQLPVRPAPEAWCLAPCCCVYRGTMSRG